LASYYYSKKDYEKAKEAIEKMENNIDENILPIDEYQKENINILKNNLKDK
jgi:hypothetical protein